MASLPLFPLWFMLYLIITPFAFLVDLEKYITKYDNKFYLNLS